MYKFMQIEKFAKQLFEDDKTVKKASEIILGILRAKSPRISEVADAMAGNAEANYKKIQRFLKKADIHSALKRFFDADAEFVMGDPTEIERAGAKKTEYVGTLSDGQQRGFWMLTLATPLRGRGLPCNFITYSSATIGNEASSRNLEHQRVIDEIREVIGKRPVVLDREFSYLGLFKHFAGSEMNFVIRLNQGSKPPKFYYDAQQNQALTLLVPPGGKIKIYRNVYYKGEIRVNVIGVWEENMKQPLWVISNIEPEEALRIYRQRMKIEMNFRDLKSILRLDTIMNKSRFYLEQMIALILIAYDIAVLVGEAIRDVRYGNITPDQLDLKPPLEIPDNSRWYSFSGVFILLRRRRRLDHAILRKIVSKVFSIFSSLIFDDSVRSFVPT